MRRCLLSTKSRHHRSKEVKQVKKCRSGLTIVVWYLLKQPACLFGFAHCVMVDVLMPPNVNGITSTDRSHDDVIRCSIPFASSIDHGCKSTRIALPA